MTNYEETLKINNYVNENIEILHKETLESMLEDFDVRFNHESTKIEGNTLSVYEVKTLLVDKISVGGKNLREIYEVTNNQKAYKYILKAIEEKRPFTEELIKDVHQIVTENIITGGIYREHNVRITGASFTPPEWTRVRESMKYFLFEYKNKKNILNPIELAAYTHAEFVKIHPFPDGNGRTARLLLNFILMCNRFKPIIINANDRPEYYKSLDLYGMTGDLNNFYNLVLEKEYEVLKEYKEEIDQAENNKE